MKNFAIYQVNVENENIMFSSLDFLKKQNVKVTIDKYNQVWEGEHITSSDDTMEILDEIYTDFNIRRPKDFKGHSLSTSDVVKLDDKYYYCDSYGWVELKDFAPKAKKYVRVECEVSDEFKMRSFKVYNLIGVRDGENHTFMTVLNEKKAKEIKERYEKRYNIYDLIWIEQKVVWVD